MPRTIETTVYQFDELTDAAKEKARDWFRQSVFSDNNDWDHVYEDAAYIGDILGIDMRCRQYETVGGKKGYDGIAIWFSGFWSQGDGACFEGTYSWKACGKAIRDHAPQDEKLHAIADALTALPYGEGWRARMKHRGHYYHSGCMSVDVEFDDEWFRQLDSAIEDAQDLPQAEFTAGEKIITDAMRAFADWIYRALEKEQEYQSSDEIVDDNIRANEYEFTEDGDRA